MRTVIRLSAIFVLASTLVVGLPQNGYDLLQKALVKERAEGQFEEAVRIYQQIIKEFAGNRALVAKALVQLGQCYEKLKHPDARKSYERVVREYRDQTDTVAEAQRLLAVLDRTVSANGSPTSRRLWAGKNDLSRGGSSTDGRTVVFTDWSSGDLVAMNIASGNERRLTHQGKIFEGRFAQGPVISPDGRFVAYSWYEEGPSAIYRLQVISTAEGSEPRELYANPEIPVIFAAGWSRDARQLLVKTSGRDGAMQIAMVAADSGTLRVVKSFGRQEPQGLSLSPDARYIAYDLPQNDGGAERDLFLLAADGSREFQLIRHPAHDARPMWTPDGRRILFLSDRGGALGLWNVSIMDGRAQGVPALIKSDAGEVNPLGFNRNGDLHYEVTGAILEFLLAEMDLETGQLLSEPVPIVSRYGKPAGGMRAAWSPDGRYIAYVVRTSSFARGGPLRVVIRETETGQEREMKLAFDTLDGAPRWRPDGNTVLVYGLAGDRPGGTFQLNVAEGSALPVPANQNWEEGCPYPQWSATNDAVWCRLDDQLVLRNLESGEEQRRVRVDTNSVNAPLSPDGRWAAFVSRNRRDLHLVSLESGERREVFKLDGAKDVLSPISWTRDSRYILARNDAGQVWRISAADSEARKLAIPVEGLRNLAVHPDGKRVVIGVVQEPDSEIWVMENFLAAAKAPR